MLGLNPSQVPLAAGSTHIPSRHVSPSGRIVAMIVGGLEAARVTVGHVTLDILLTCDATCATLRRGKLHAGYS